MFMLDVETAAKTTEAVLLSVGIVYFDPAKKPSVTDMRSDSVFVKFDAAEQIKKYHRKTQKSTMDWWMKQSDEAKKYSLIPNKELDQTLEDGMENLRKFVKEHNASFSDYCWVRGFLDSMIMDSVEEQLEIKPIFNYNKYRDVRTALDFLYNSTNGYPDYEYPYDDPYDDIGTLIAHHPVDDSIRDAVLMIYGKEKEN